MDAQMQSSQTALNQYQTWDYLVNSGIVPILQNSQEQEQAAAIAAFIQTGTIPQLPDYGVDWVGFFAGEVDIGVIDNSIKQNLASAGLADFSPTYDLVNGNLICRVSK